MELVMQGRDVWARNTWISYHRVWDAGLFFERRAVEAKKEGGSCEQCLPPGVKPKN